MYEKSYSSKGGLEATGAYLFSMRGRWLQEKVKINTNY